MENETPIIYSGRAVLSDWIYRTKNIASKQSNLPRRKHTSKQIQILYRQRTRRLKHSINAMLRGIFEILESKDICELFIGDLSHIRDEANHGDRGNQKLDNFWIFNMITGRLYELGDEYGIAITKVPEKDTSKTCCLCGKKHNGRIERGLIVCKEYSKSINADVNGAVNILKVAMNRSLSERTEISGSGVMAHPLLLRWNYNEWK
jgi:putative transposase